MSKLFNGDCLEILPKLKKFTCLIADPPDNIGLKYNNYKDNIDNYVDWLDKCINQFVQSADISWISYNSKWSSEIGYILYNLKKKCDIEIKYCVQVYTFGQHNKYDLGNNHRPIVRLRWPNTKLYPDSIRVKSWRQLNGDKRANPNGRVPGDVFDVPRVTGNSKQRRKYHPTQLNEVLVERCIKLSTKEGDSVIDPFAGTGTTLRVCKKINRSCNLIELDKFYCDKIMEEHEEIKKIEKIT